MGTAIGLTHLVGTHYHPLEVGQGTVSDSDLVIDDQNLTYNGMNATGITLAVNNTDNMSHIANVYVNLVESSGNKVASGSQTGLRVKGHTVKPVMIEISPATNITDYQHVRVRIEETG